MFDHRGCWKTRSQCGLCQMGHRGPLCAAGSQAPAWTGSQPTALSVTKPASLLDGGFGLSLVVPLPCHSFFLPHTHSILHQKPHQSPRAFLTLSKYIHHSGGRLERRRRWQGMGCAESGEGALGHLPSPSWPCSPRPKELLCFHSSVPSVQGSDGDF